MTEELLVQACMHNSLCYEELSWKLHLKYVSVAFRRIPRNSTYSDMLHTCYWISANKSSSIDIMSVALIFQAAAELLLSWRAHTAGLSISDATIRMKRQYRNMQRTATEKGEQEKILKKNKLKKKINVFLPSFPQSLSWIKNSWNYRKITLQLLFHIRKHCRNSMDALDWGKDSIKGITLKKEAMWSLQIQERS